MFQACPNFIGSWERIDYNIEVNYVEPEVLLELIEYKVILPILCYRFEEEVIALEFNETHYRVKRLRLNNGEIDEDILEAFPPTKLQDAVHYLVHTVSAK